MLIKMKILLGLLALIAPLSSHVEAASQDECSIWICLPSGFMSGCSAAHSAMNVRLAKHQPPLPRFSECAAKSNGQSDMSYDNDYAAYVPGGRQCVKWDYRGDSSYCSEYASYEGHYVKGTKCRKGSEDSRHPDGCTKTVRYVDVYADRAMVGDTYYY